MIINPYRFASGATSAPTPLHFWNLDTTSFGAGGGLEDLGSGTNWVDMTLANGAGGAAASALPTGGLNGQGVLDFDGGDYVHFVDAGSTPVDTKPWDGVSTTQISVSCWAFMDVGSTTGNWLWSWRKSTTDRLTHGLFFTSPDPDYSTSQVWDAGDDTVNANDPTEVAALTTWYHLAMTWDGTTIRHYIDGVEFGTGTNALVGSFSTANMPFALGTASWSKGFAGNSHDGRIGATGIWDAALTADEVAYLHDEVRTGGADGFYADYTWT